MQNMQKQAEVLEKLRSDQRGFVPKGGSANFLCSLDIFMMESEGFVDGNSSND